MPNRLASESSPYLRQHAENPVDWYPWGAEALKRARDEDRAILLSVGYSSCHWCHVMERESFEDPSIAGLMNRLFVNIKVDREERPDIDQIYMKAVQAMSGRGGWPMTVFLTPDGVPFFGGTYYPPEPRPGIPSFPDVLRSIADAWENRRDEVEAGGARLLEALRATMERGAGADSESKASIDVDTALSDAAVDQLARRYDAVHGGFGRAPKFPQPVTLELLLAHHARTGAPRSLSMAVHTLRAMARGGMRDHLAGGFHRYSVDARWLVPHFEKMLYDNALLARAYLDAWKLTGSDDLSDVATAILDDLTRDMRAPEGGFYAARDADSEGVEGRFYVWDPDEVAEVLGADADLFCRAYDITPDGNFEGASIPNLREPLESVAEAVGLPVLEVEDRLDRCRHRLLEHRAGRVAPFRDEKVIVSWNAFAIRAFAEVGAALGRADYTETASEAASFLWEHLRRDGRLLHSAINGTTSGGGYLDDHAGLGNALLSLHAATLERRWLDRAIDLGEQTLEHFVDPHTGAAWDTSHDAESLVLRPRDPIDSATPSGPSLAAELFARLGALTDRDEFRNAARRIVVAEADALVQLGPAFGRMLSVVERMSAPPVEVALTAPAGADVGPMLRAVHACHHPGLVVTGRIGDPEDEIDMPLLHGRTPTDGQPTAWICRNYACDLPRTAAHDVEAALAGI